MQLLGIRALAGLYLFFFMALALQVLIEGLATQGWTTTASDTSVLIGVAALSGWFPAALGVLNFLFGFAGGLFAKPVATESSSAMVARYSLLVLTTLLLVLSLLALWSVANAYHHIAANLTPFHAGADGTAQLTVADAIKALGALNLSMAAGFLAGLAVPGTPGFKAPGE